MKVLLVKTSSMGDVIHSLPAVTDAMRAVPGIRFDWVIEEGIAAIPTWHPAVDRVIPIAFRRWRRHPLAALQEMRAYLSALRAQAYDAIVDAQGLMKSAFLSVLPARGQRHGFDRRSARESAAALTYQHRVRVPRYLHAVERTRQLMADSLGYSLPEGMGDYGLRQRFAGPVRDRTLLFAHGTTWPEKHWPEPYWHELAGMAIAAGWTVELPWGTDAERERAIRIAAGRPGIEVLPRLSLEEIARRIATATAVVSVDTGLSHLAAALDRPNVVLFGPTDPALVGGYGRDQFCLKASEQTPVSRQVEPPIFAALTPQIVWRQLIRAVGPRPGGDDR